MSMTTFAGYVLVSMVSFTFGMAAMLLLSAAKDRERELEADEAEEAEDQHLDAQMVTLPPAPRGHGQPVDLGEVPAFLRRQAE